VFQVGGNQLTSLPAEIGKLTLLENLFVRNSN
jgi:Leucine-rich repeat (LRR) protein